MELLRARNKEGVTALHIACMEGHTGVAKATLEGVDRGPANPPSFLLLLFAFLPLLPSSYC
jgi:ankyrin repeat protein